MICEKGDESIKENEIKNNKFIINTDEKKELWKDILTNSETSYNYNYNYNENENEKILHKQYNKIFKDFYNYAVKINKNICGYIFNNEINNMENNKTYSEEIYTLINIYNDKEPPGNYINNIFNKDLNIIKTTYLLCNNGYWIIEPLDNIKKINENTKKIVYIYFIILRILYLNKYYPFNNGDVIQKYKNLVQIINLKLILDIKKNNKFKNYIDTQLNTIYNINENMDDIIKIIKQKNINKVLNNILKLNYYYYN